MENPTVRDAVENCRYCFMCRHAGTAFRATKRDALTARGRALQLSRVLDGFAGWTPVSADTMFEDPVDGLCRHLCAFNWPEDELVRDARERIVGEGAEPQSVRDAVAAMAGTEPGDWQPAAAETGSDSRVLFLSGWAARRFAGKLIDDQLAVLKAGFGSVRMLADERATTAAALRDLGQKARAEEAAAALAALIAEIRPERIVTGCSHTLRVLHGEAGGPDHSKSIPVQHFTEAVVQLVDEGRLKLAPRAFEGVAALHDAEHLARTRGLVDPPRKLMNAVLSGSFSEFEHHGARAESAGAGAALFLTHPGLSAVIADTRLKQAGEAGLDLVVTACPHDFIVLAPRAMDGRKVEDISGLVRRAAGI